MSIKNYDGVLSRLHVDVAWSFMFSEGAASEPLVGHEAVLQGVLRGGDGVFRSGDPKIVLDTILSNDDLVLAETHAVGERSDGRPYVNRYAWAFEFSGERISKVREYMDTLYITDFMVIDQSAGDRT